MGVKKNMLIISMTLPEYSWHQHEWGKENGISLFDIMSEYEKWLKDQDIFESYVKHTDIVQLLFPTEEAALLFKLKYL